ncbi:Maf family protein [Zavarzinia sp. CC-PAN008]|uniref:Maf family protein n=1 Tax=Zavarzinia sp. CC-PAN008 TaxID=3243332 RepID=UPI003F74970E
MTRMGEGADQPAPHPEVILASASRARAQMLHAAGVAVTIEPARIDELAIKQSLQAEKASPTDIATLLAELKAVRISERRPDAFVIGSDQVLECNGVLFDKPPDLDHARAQLQALRGRPHRLIAAVCVAQGGVPVWRHVQHADLHMRRFSDLFLDHYITQESELVLASVGAYRVEGLGAQLFERIDGDWFTILGMPLLPLLAYLRERAILPA